MGVIHPMNKYSRINLRATCRADGHTRCFCHVTVKENVGVSREALLCDLASWLARSELSAADHKKASEDLRIAYGIKVKS